MADIAETPELQTAENVPKDWMLLSLVRPLLDRGINLMQAGAALAGKAGLIYGVDQTSSGPQAGVEIDMQNAQLLSGYKATFDVPPVTAGTLTINSANAATYAGRMIDFDRAGGCVLTIDSSVGDGFNMSVWQVNTGAVTFAGSGLTLSHRQGHTKTAGQKAWATIIVKGTELRLGGDTST
jgi:hypothetical protein